MEHRGALQLCGTVRLAILIDEQWEGDAGLQAELARKKRVAQANGSQRCASVSDFICALAQLRDMLAAEDSPVVA